MFFCTAQPYPRNGEVLHISREAKRKQQKKRKKPPCLLGLDQKYNGLFLNPNPKHISRETVAGSKSPHHDPVALLHHTRRTQLLPKPANRKSARRKYNVAPYFDIA